MAFLLLAEFNSACYLDGVVHYFDVVLAICTPYCAGLATQAFYSKGFFAFTTMGSSAALANLAAISRLDPFAYPSVGMHPSPFSCAHCCGCVGEYGVFIVVAILWFEINMNLLALSIRIKRAPPFKMKAYVHAVSVMSGWMFYLMFQ